MKKMLTALFKLDRRVKCSLVQVPGEGVKTGYGSSPTGGGSRIPGSNTTSWPLGRRDSEEVDSA